MGLEVVAKSWVDYEFLLHGVKQCGYYGKETVVRFYFKRVREKTIKLIISRVDQEYLGPHIYDLELFHFSRFQYLKPRGAINHITIYQDWYNSIDKITLDTPPASEKYCSASF